MVRLGLQRKLYATSPIEKKVQFSSFLGIKTNVKPILQQSLTSYLFFLEKVFIPVTKTGQNHRKFSKKSFNFVKSPRGEINFSVPLEDLAPTDQRQTSLSETSGTHTQYLKPCAHV